MAQHTMSEARYNDLIYMTLKKLFFEPWGMNPRECDIRVCMQMGYRPMLDKAGPMAGILLPDEVSPRSHESTYDIDTDKALVESIDYM